MGGVCFGYPCIGLICTKYLGTNIKISYSGGTMFVVHSAKENYISAVLKPKQQPHIYCGQSFGVVGSSGNFPW